MSRVINVGIVGFGMVSQVFHCPIITSNPDFRLTKVVERHTSNSKKRYPWVEVVDNFEELLQDKEIELVVLNVPNELHFKYAKAALLASKNVVVEKPFTITSEEADELIELSKKQNKMLSVFQNRRWDGDFQTVKKLIESNSLGRLVEYESHFDRFRNKLKPNSWREEDRPGSGMLYDLGSHLIDQALVLFGFPKEVWGDMRIQRDHSPVVDSFEVIMKYDNLKVTLKSGMLVREALPRFILHGTEGTYIKYGLDVQEDSLKRGMTPIDLGWGEDPKDMWGTLNTEINGLHFVGKIETIKGSYEEYYKNIYDVLVNGKELIVKPEQARDTIKIIEMVSEKNKGE